MVSILFKRDASYIDGVNICYLNKLLLHAMTCMLLHIIDVFIWQIFVEWSVVSAKLAEVGIGPYLVLPAAVCQKPRFQTCIQAQLFYVFIHFFI